MENIFIYILPLSLLGSLLYYFFVTQKITHEAETEFLKKKEALVGKKEEVFFKYLSEENGFKTISKILSDNEIIMGLTACLKRKTGQQIAVQLVTNTLKSIVESIIRKFTIRVLGYYEGYEFSREDKGLYYLVMTNKALHYLFFNEQKLIEHQQFNFNEMQNFTQTKANSKDVFLKGGALRYPKISFNTVTRQLTFFYLEGIKHYPNGVPLERQAMLEVNHLFIAPFKNKIAQLLI